MLKKREIYMTNEAAAILGIEPRAVKNFSDVAAYGLAKRRLGAGPGSRRYYTFSDVVRLEIALELSICGFTPDAIGKALGEITESTLDWEAQSKDSPILVCNHGRWRVEKLREAERRLTSALHGEWNGVFILYVHAAVEVVVRRIQELEEKGKLQRR